mgnify:FL=1
MEKKGILHNNNSGGLPASATKVCCFNILAVRRTGVRRSYIICDAESSACYCRCASV